MLNSTNLPLDRKKIIKKTLEKSFIFLFFLMIGNMVGAVFLLILGFKLWWLIIACTSIVIPTILISCIYIYQVYYYKLYFYNFEEDGAQIRKGVISQNTGHVRYERIQNIYVDQDVLDRIFGLFDVHYETAGETSGIYSHVDGLNKENSEKLIKFLNNKLYKQNNKVNQDSIESNINSGEKKTTNEDIIDRDIVPILKRVIIQNTITNTLSFLMIIFFLFTFVIFDTENINASNGTIATIFVGINILNFLANFIYQKIWLKNFYFKFSDNSGIIKSQVIVLSNSYIYYDRIQNINVTQRLIERLFGLYSVTIETAAKSGNQQKLHIPGLSYTGSEKLKNFLLAKVDIYKNKL